MAPSISRLVGPLVLPLALALSSTAYASPGPCIPLLPATCPNGCAASPVGIGAGGGLMLAGVAVAGVLLHRRRRGR
jgi:uncharacterized protein (TIGR03382 family)